ncbi:RrF2 family transcriptional regulator [Neotabrizicola sp. sgz301269]|uniref:RrF2 family transcriptional regulator n=1 Tax=Neotabrizicola sp. sgz301269 TaxID=3276282 RepID=UPI0037701E8B
MRLTVRANLAMRILMQAAVNAPGVIRAVDVARACNASVNHVSQVVSQLALAGYLNTQRGRGGGIVLAQAPGAVRVGEVLRLIEADVPLAECMSRDDNTCPLTAACRLRGALCRALDAFYAALDEVSLDHLIANNPALAGLLAHEKPPLVG